MSRITRPILSYLAFANRHKFLTLLVLLLTVVASTTVASRLQLLSSLKELLPDKSQSVQELNRLIELEMEGSVG